MKYNEVNPLNVHGLRQLNFCPPHFKKITIRKDETELKHVQKIKVVIDWIYEHLSGRFYINSSVSDKGKFANEFTIAFEEHSELSFFILSIPTIK